MAMSDDENMTEDQEATATYPLAWGQHGDPLELPAEAAGWRVRRHRLGAGGGISRWSTSRAGPLILPLDATIDDLLEQAAGKPGRYRLEPVDAAGRLLKTQPALAVIEKAAPSEAQSTDLDGRHQRAG